MRAMAMLISKGPRPEGPYYTPEEAARELNMDIYEFYTLIEEGKVKALKIHYERRLYYWIHKDEVRRLKERMTLRREIAR